MSYFQIIKTPSKNDELLRSRIKFYEIIMGNEYYYVNFSLQFFDIVDHESLALNTFGEDFIKNIKPPFYIGVGLMKNKENEEDVLERLAIVDKKYNDFRVDTLYKIS